MGKDSVDSDKRKVLVGTTVAAFGVGAGFVAVPFLKSMAPSERAKAAGAPVEVDLSKIAVGQRVSVTYRGKPVWIVRRSREVLDNLKTMDARVLDPNSKQSKQPEYCANPTRSVEGHEEFFVAVSLCTHLGCVPSYRPEIGAQDFDSNWMGGFYCACHGSVYDLAGRVYPGVPAPINLEIPPYAFVNKNKIIIGLNPEDLSEGEA